MDHAFGYCRSHNRTVVEWGICVEYHKPENVAVPENDEHFHFYIFHYLFDHIH